MRHPLRGVGYGGYLEPFPIVPTTRSKRCVYQAPFPDQGPEVVREDGVASALLRIPLRVEQPNGRSPVLRLTKGFVVWVRLGSHPAFHVGVDALHQERPAVLGEHRIGVEVEAATVYQIEVTHPRVVAHLIQLVPPLIHSRAPSSAS